MCFTIEELTPALAKTSLIIIRLTASAMSFLDEPHSISRLNDGLLCCLEEQKRGRVRLNQLLETKDLRNRRVSDGNLKMA